MFKYLTERQRWLLTFVISILGSFVIYKVHALSNEWSFTIAFLGGATTMLFLSLIHDKGVKKNDN